MKTCETCKYFELDQNDADWGWCWFYSNNSEDVINKKNHFVPQCGHDGIDVGKNFGCIHHQTK